MVQFIKRCRRPIILVVHMVLILFANYLAFWLRFDGAIPADAQRLFGQMLLWLMLIRGLTFMPFRLYEGLWRYTDILDLKNIILGVVISTLLFYSLVHFGFKSTGYPRSVFIIDAILLIVFMGGIRMVRRICKEIWHRDSGQRMLIFGAGDAGEMIVREIGHSPFYNAQPIGFVDDDANKVGRRIHGIKVLGTRYDLPAIFKKHTPDTVLIAMPRVGPAETRQIVKVLESFKVPIKTLPNLRDVLDGKVTVGQIRNLSIEDLLDRVPVELDPEPVRHLIAGKCVMVTGAGGSIGSELCRQIAALKPASLLLYERYENGLYTVDNELSSKNDSCRIHSIVGDVTDLNRVNSILVKYRPEIIFHAAAHKHVPLMELNPYEAVKNNILGTKIMTEAASRHGIQRFILVSTDKAVNPTSVMGATKRVGEFLVQGMNQAGHGIFSAVRFGNVLGSNGSVVPRFVEQIRAGGPVTVTHPEVKRYFMLISEAVHLVLHAAAIAKGGEVFVLEMGEQIKIVDMAHTLIQLSGFAPGKEIPIFFVGLRPGEKLYEETVGNDEAVKPSSVKGINRVFPGWLPGLDFLLENISKMEGLAIRGESKAIIKQLQEIVPTYQPAGLNGATHCSGATTAIPEKIYSVLD
ncbi:MAG: polysaccharide biosynthesis protein [Nitrospirae bacterium]|nr:polysaccharide biosynthesis protein [Nitrospirota bacterium]